MSSGSWPCKDDMAKNSASNGNVGFFISLRTCIRQLPQISAAAVVLGSSGNVYTRLRSGRDSKTAGQLAPLSPRLTEVSLAFWFCPPRIPAGEPDTRLPAAYCGLFPCSEGVGRTAHGNPKSILGVCLHHHRRDLILSLYLLHCQDAAAALRTTGRSRFLPGHGTDSDQPATLNCGSRIRP
jgi:hypothetical protein